MAQGYGFDYPYVYRFVEHEREECEMIDLADTFGELSVR